MVECKASGCKNEGTEKVEYVLLGGLKTEYYCKTHDKEIQLRLKMLEAVSKNRRI